MSHKLDWDEEDDCGMSYGAIVGILVCCFGCGALLYLAFQLMQK